MLQYETENYIFNYNENSKAKRDILEIAKRKDITITLHHPMDFPEEGFEAYIVETDKWVHSGKEFILEYYKVNGQLGGLQM